MMVNRFKYKTVHIEPLGTEVFDLMLDELGQFGWEAYHIERTADGGRLVYMKKAEEVAYGIPEGEFKTYVDDGGGSVHGDSIGNSEPCGLCGFVGGQHHPHCPVHPDNKDKSGVSFCHTCNWIYGGEHTNPECEDYEEEEK